MGSPEIDLARTRVGWIGLGVMGTSMCGNLLAAGCPVTVTTRTPSRADELVARGARWVHGPAAVASAAEVIFTMVGYPRDVRDVVLGSGGVLTQAAPGSVLVDMTTSEPSLAAEIAERAHRQEVVALDAPVSGGDVGARQGTLSIMIGGDAATVEALTPYWELMGSTVVRQGGPGAGQHTKMVNQTLIASNMIGVAEALLYAAKAGLDIETVLRSVSTGAAGSWSLANLAPRMVAGNFDPGFYVEHFVKDMGIALAEAERMGLALPGLALAKQLYVALVAQGRGRLGTQALILALADLSATAWPPT